MAEGEEKEHVKFEIELKQILEIVGMWFDSKLIQYSDSMFDDYFDHVKSKLMTSDSLSEYIRLRINELIFKLLSVHHERQKTLYKDVMEEEEEIVPAWFLTERYAEIEEMFSSKFLSYTFDEVDTEYDSNVKAFTVTLHLEKEIDSSSYETLMNDIKTYLENRITLLNFNDGKIIEPDILEITFGLDW